VTVIAAPERVICVALVTSKLALMFDMEVIVRRHDQEHCASITCMIRHYVARRAKVIEDHPHHAAERAVFGVANARRRCRQPGLMPVSAG
jgi:hypothetical protein